MSKKITKLPIGQISDYSDQIKSKQTKDVAVIGMAFRVPSASCPREFWQLLKDGQVEIRDFPKRRADDINAFLEYSSVDTDSVKYGKASYLDRIDTFDHDFFGIAPVEAELMDPHQRIFFEVAHEAIEDAGYGGKKLLGSSTGVYVAFNSKKGRNYEDLIAQIGCDESELTFSGNIPAIAASRISYMFDLKGPNLLVDTACSSSLMALHLACQGLYTGDCETALVGAITLNLAPFDIFRKQGIESQDGLTRAFDDSSTGTGTGEGVLAILIKPLYKALEDKDDIYAVIKGSSSNQDGRSNGLTAPNPQAQADLICKAWQDAQINPESISYIETHGTGTKLGDPIEVMGIKSAFERYTHKKQFCGIGSVKSNLGHLDTSAGLVGFVKAILALQHKEIPATLFFEYPNRNIDFIDSPVYVCCKNERWKPENYPRRAGVSSFGISGTNCHVVLEEYNSVRCPKDTDTPAVLVISAKNETSLMQIVKKYIEDKERLLQYSLQDICYTAAVGRDHYLVRLALIVDSVDDMIAKLIYVLREGLGTFSEQQIWYQGDTKQLKEYQAILLQQARRTLDDNRDVGMEILCEQYVAGVDIAWEEFYKENTRQIVHLPTYAFLQTRCWPRVPKKEITPYMRVGYCTVDHSLKPELIKNRSIFLLVGRDEKHIKALAEEIRILNKVAICAIISNECVYYTETYYRINDISRDIMELIKNIGDESMTVVIVGANNRHDFVDMSRVIDDFQAEVLEPVDVIKGCGTMTTRRLEIIFYTVGAHSVLDAEPVLNIYGKALHSLRKTLSIEQPLWNCRSIDTDLYTSGEFIARQIVYGTSANVIIRKDTHYMEELQPVDDVVTVQETSIKKNAVYIITGGLGIIGQEVAKWLSSVTNNKVVLLGRTKLGSKQQAFLDELQDTVYYQNDITDEKATAGVLDTVREKFGEIKGVFHCAANSLEDSGIMEYNFNKWNVLKDPKIIGTCILDKLTRADRLDFMVLFSSAITIFPLPGLGLYNLTNSFLDSFAEWRTKQGYKTVAIDYAGWNIGMGARLQQDVQDNGLFKQLDKKNGLEALQVCLTLPLSRVCVGVFNPISSDTYQQFRDHFDIVLAASLVHGFVGGNEKQNDCVVAAQLSGRIDGMFTEMEQRVGDIFADILGYKNINIDQDFFEMGGHSLLAIKLEYELTQLGISVSNNDIYSYPTVRLLSEFIEKEVN